MPILTQSANLKDNVLIELAQWTAEQVDIANVVARNNRSLSAGDGKYTNPVDNKESFGQLKSPDKAGYGTKLVVQEDNKRDNIILMITLTIETYNGVFVSSLAKKQTTKTLINT